MARILIADDEVWVRELLRELLKDEYELELAEDGEAAWQALAEGGFAVALLDVRMPRRGGLDVLSEMARAKLDTVPIVVTANRDVDTAVLAMKQGAWDYVVKPFDNEKLLVQIRNAVERWRLAHEVETLRHEVTGRWGFGNLVGRSPAMRDVVAVLEKVADTDATLLVTGPSGTGKEVVARTVHWNSSRRGEPFVALDCAAVPDTLIENEFFGHERGSFTGAHERSRGKFEAAGAGTLFLDEIGNLRPDVQAKLLRVLQEREFTRIGGGERIRMRARVICATNADLEKEIAAGRFREDLFYRLNVVPLRLPSLRERSGDVPLLAGTFLARFAKENGKLLSFSPGALEALAAYHWPGNVRELENLVNRLVVMKEAGEVIEAADLPPHLTGRPGAALEGLSTAFSLDELEERYIAKVLAEERHNISRAARRLGITRKTLHNKLNRIGQRDAAAEEDPADDTVADGPEPSAGNA